MKITHVVPSANAETGGPAISVSELASSLAELGHECSVLALNYPSLGAPRGAGGADLRLYPASSAAQKWRGWSPGFRRMVEESVDAGTEIVHGNGLWMFPNRYAMLAAKRSGVPLVISPRGMLQPWSRRRSRIKKFIAWHMYEASNIRGAAAFHATSVDEARSIRALGVRAPIAVIPNGVSLPAAMNIPRPAKKRYALFLSRLHEKKGIETLLEAWAAVKRERRDVHLMIAGSDLSGGDYRASLESMSRELGLSDSVTFTGAVDGEAKSGLFAAADVFVLPSFSENFGLVVAEALSHGVPVITTTATPWKSIADTGCGWWIGTGVGPLITALRESFALSDAERHHLGDRGRALVKDRFSWNSAALAMGKFYSWIRDEECSAASAPTFLAE